MPIEATILTPTFDHGPTLLRSIPSALRQTVTDIEVLVIGDGAPDITRDIMRQFERDDERVRYFDHPKGPRHGEIYRHAVLTEHARGRIVCYLSDDDLYLPHHVETMLGLLDGADFAHSLPVRIDADGSLHTWTIDITLPTHFTYIVDDQNRIPLGNGAHTMELYRRLPHGWRTTPKGTPTDLYMWRQILGLEGLRVRSGFEPTQLHLPSVGRIGIDMEARYPELDAWAERISTEEGVRAILHELLHAKAREAAEIDAALIEARRECFNIAAGFYNMPLLKLRPLLMKMPVLWKLVQERRPYQTPESSPESP